MMSASAIPPVSVSVALAQALVPVAALANVRSRRTTRRSWSYLASSFGLAMLSGSVAASTLVLALEWVPALAGFLGTNQALDLRVVPSEVLPVTASADLPVELARALILALDLALILAATLAPILPLVRAQMSTRAWPASRNHLLPQAAVSPYMSFSGTWRAQE